MEHNQPASFTWYPPITYIDKNQTEHILKVNHGNSYRFPIGLASSLTDFQTCTLMYSQKAPYYQLSFYLGHQ